MMTGLMLWMSGGMHIVGIMMLFMALWTPIKGILSVNSAFEKFSDLGLLIPQKMLFITLHLGALGIGKLFINRSSNTCSTTAIPQPTNRPTSNQQQRYTSAGAWGCFQHQLIGHHS